jgi:hypothetical protein
VTPEAALRKVLVVGGYNGKALVATAELYDPGS